MLRKKTPSRTTQSPKTMTLLLTTPESSTRSSSGSTSFLGSETKDSCYFPGCRKDANCKCEICIESMNAMLDLMPQSTQRSSLTRLSAAPEFKTPSRNQLCFEELSPLTPKSGVDDKVLDDESPLLDDSTARVEVQEKGGRRKKGELGFGLMFRRVLVVLGFFLVLEFGVSWMVSGFFERKFSGDVVRVLGQESGGLKDLSKRLDFFKNEMQRMVDKNVTDCHSFGSSWKLNQDGLLLNSRCVLYKSMSEEVSIWGWPLQTAGLLTSDFSSRSFTVLSGRVTEWTNGMISYIVHKTDCSWNQQKWDSSPVQLDANTWILEYKQSYIMENARLVSAAFEFTKFRVTREFRKMKQEFWHAFAFWSYPIDFRLANTKTPT